MFMLDGKPLAIDTPFTHNGVQYPANWLRLTTLAEKVAIGITEVADPVPFDDRFFWSANHPKDEAVVKEMLIGQMKQTAYSMLAPTDYKLVRKVETGEDVDQTTLDYRAAVRSAYNTNVAAINAAVSTAEMATMQFTWPSNESTP